MRKTISTVGRAFVMALVLVAPVVAQDQLQAVSGSGSPGYSGAIGYNAPVERGKMQAAPTPAAEGANINFSAGYSSMRMAIPGAGHVLLNGFNASGTADLRANLGATAEASYARASNFLGTPHSGFVATLLAGPVFYPFEHRNTRVFLHGLAGFGMVDGAEPLTGPDFRHGWLRRPAYEAGGGFERPLTGPFGLRVSADYVRTAFFDKAGTVQGQNNIRLGIGLVFPFRQRWTGNYVQP